MKVLFIASGNANTPNGITSIVYNQGESLRREGIEVDYFGVKGKGIAGYLKAIRELKSVLSKNNYNVIHSHYGLCGIVAYYAHSNEKLVQSFMGSDIYGNFHQQGKSSPSSSFLAWLSRRFKGRYDYCITKSLRMKNLFKDKKNIDVIPNGVSFKDIRLIDKEIAKKELGLNSDKKYIIFPANRGINRKNFSLVEQAVKQLNHPDVEILAYDGIPYEKVNLFLNSGDVCMLPSFAEGSPNAIKEAMAVSIPIVATDVGDVKELIGNTEGCYICDFSVEDAAKKLELALGFGKRTTGREDIDHLDSRKVAKKIIKIYDSII